MTIIRSSVARTRWRTLLPTDVALPANVHHHARMPLGDGCTEFEPVVVSARRALCSVAECGGVFLRIQTDDVRHTLIGGATHCRPLMQGSLTADFQTMCPGMSFRLDDRGSPCAGAVLLSQCLASPAYPYRQTQEGWMFGCIAPLLPVSACRGSRRYPMHKRCRTWRFFASLHTCSAEESKSGRRFVYN